MTSAHVRHVKPVPPAAARGTVARVYRDLADEFGILAPPVVLHSPAPDVLAACWTMLRETLLVEAAVGRRTKEIVATAVSLANRCPYCVEVHSTAVDGLAGTWAAPLMRTHGLDGVTDPRLRDLARWAQATAAQPPERPPAPFTADEEAEIIGVVVTFHHINRMVNVFLRDSPMPRMPARADGPVRRLTGRVLGAWARPRRLPGRSLDLLPAATTAADLSWAAGRDHIATAFARAGAAVDAAGGSCVPEPVLQTVETLLAERPAVALEPHDRGWLDAAVGRLPQEHRAAGRLASLTAFASYRVTDQMIGEVRDRGYDDAALIGLTAWASLAAARTIGARLRPEPITR
ncbi:alkyl hydroperoxide reductase AhpD [Actinoplanes italicus]|nr:alkyl hydroperoxide reductase AhpD [Actinoplanes italicus]